MLFSCFQVISNMPTIAVEEATPVTVDEAQTLAPEEIGVKTKVRHVNENREVMSPCGRYVFVLLSLGIFLSHEFLSCRDLLLVLKKGTRRIKSEI